MKVIKADIIVPDCYIEMETTEEDLSKEDIELMLFEELQEGLPGLNIKYIYDVEEKTK